jgi:protein gp37
VGDKSKIEWTQGDDGTRGATWNPVTGCDRVSPGCSQCYAMTLAARLKAMGSPRYQVDGDPRTSGPGFGVTLHPDTLDQPLRWAKPRRIFVNSMSDLFHPAVPDEFIEKVFDVMRDAPRHTFQVLTKRPQRMANWTSSYYDCDHGGLLSPECGYCQALGNVWLGASIESGRYTFRADHVRAAKAAVRFLSCEPLLGPLINLDLTDIDWLIVGGESGHHARPMEWGWVARLIEDARAAGAAVFVKQSGSVLAGHGKGGDMSAWPEEFRIREMPA